MNVIPLFHLVLAEKLPTVRCFAGIMAPKQLLVAVWISMQMGTSRLMLLQDRKKKTKKNRIITHNQAPWIACLLQRWVLGCGGWAPRFAGIHALSHPAEPKIKSSKLTQSSMCRSRCFNSDMPPRKVSKASQAILWEWNNDWLSTFKGHRVAFALPSNS